MSSDKPKSIDALAHLLHNTEKAIRVTNDIRRRHYGSITGVVTDVNDPAEKGRVLVKLDAFRHESVVEEWCPVVGAYNGVQPKLMIGQKVLIAPIEGNTHLYRVIGMLDGDIGTYDPATDQGEFDQHTDENNYKDLQDLKLLTARTGPMFRLPVYSIPAGDNLPVCHSKNHGACIVIDDGLNSFQLTCLRVKGGFGWITNQRQKYKGDLRPFSA